MHEVNRVEVGAPQLKRATQRRGVGEEGVLVQHLEKALLHVGQTATKVTSDIRARFRGTTSRNDSGDAALRSPDWRRHWMALSMFCLPLLLDLARSPPREQLCRGFVHL